MKKINLYQKTVTLIEGTSRIEANFASNFPGEITGVITKVMGAIPLGESADISIQDGATPVLNAIDISVTEITTKNSIEGATLPINVANPGEIKAIITPSRTLGVGETYKVKIMIFYNEANNQYDDC